MADYTANPDWVDCRALRAAEEAAGTLTTEKAAEYDAAIEASRKQREAELTSTFAELPDFLQREENLKALQARMDTTRPGSTAYAELDAEIKKAQEEVAAARAKQAELDAEKAQGSAFAKVPPTPGTGGMYSPALEQQREEQQQATRDFAFGPTATNAPGDPVTIDTLKTLKISDRSKVGMGLLGTDLGTVEGRRKFIQTLEKPDFVGSINESAYDDIISTFDPKEVGAARAEMRSEELSPTKQKQQGQTRAFAFGDSNVTKPDTTTSGTSTDVAGQPAATAVSEGTTEPERGGVDVIERATPDAPSGEGQQPGSLTEEITSGTQTAETIKTEAQGQKAPAATPTIITARGTSVRPDLSTETPVVKEKLGKRGAKLDEQATDASAYFNKVSPEMALDSIANDLVFQPTAYRNSKMTLPSVSKPGAVAVTPEPMFGTKAEAAFFKGQGGIHAKNAEAWARANLSPEAVSFLDEKIAEYTKQKQNVEVVRRRQEAAQGIRKAGEQQIKEEAAETRYESVRRVEKALDEYYENQENIGRISDSDLSSYLADSDLAALHTQAHPVVLSQLENNNLIGALNALADSGSSKSAERFASELAKVVGNVNLVYGAERSMYDPTTNTVYLRDGATEYEILHEASHAAMSHTLDNPSHPVTRQVTTLFNQMKKSTEGTYGAQNVQEFAAEAWSNDAFRSRLKEFKPTGEKLTGWERLVNAVRQLFRMPPKYDTALSAIDRMLNDIISPPPETRMGETMYAQSLHKPNVVQEMFSNMGEVIRKQPVMNSENAVGFWMGAEKIGNVGRKLMYKALNLSALGQAATKYLGEAPMRFSAAVDEMAGYQDSLLESMAPLHRRLQEFRQSDRYQAWSTLVNESTREDVNPAAPFSKYQGSPEKEAMWKKFNAQYLKLNDEGKKLFKDLFATYKMLDKEFEKSLEHNIIEGIDGKERALSAYQKILQETYQK